VAIRRVTTDTRADVRLSVLVQLSVSQMTVFNGPRVRRGYLSTELYRNGAIADDSDLNVSR